MKQRRWVPNIAGLASLILHLLLVVALIRGLVVGGDGRPGDSGAVMYATFVADSATEAPDAAALAQSPPEPVETIAATEAVELQDTGAAPAESRRAIAAPRLVTATSQGDEASAAGAPGMEIQLYQHLLLDHIERYRRYPAQARRQQMEGVVMLRFLLDRRGYLLEIWVDRSSGFTMLDAEAVAAVRRAQPMPAIPASLPDRIGILLPISFSLG